MSAAIDAIETRSVQANGLRFNVAVAGEGPVVVLLHGFPDTLRVWQRQIGALAAAGYRVIAPDQRGCGDSDVPDGVGAYRLETLADDIIALLDALDVREPAHPAGHDWRSEEWPVGKDYCRACRSHWV